MQLSLLSKLVAEVSDLCANTQHVLKVRQHLKNFLNFLECHFSFVPWTCAANVWINVYGKITLLCPVISKSSFGSSAIVHGLLFILKVGTELSLVGITWNREELDIYHLGSIHSCGCFAWICLSLPHIILAGCTAIVHNLQHFQTRPPSFMFVFILRVNTAQLLWHDGASHQS